ncbi:hypothetical protein [Comamonas sp. 4034]|uniref:hypothetical protein n=1 Tax=Comamonas sp. 4034 TaxID=3156455 RepID=UPI003D24FF8D
MRMRSTSTVFLPSLMTALVLTACGGGGSDDDDDTPPLPTPTYGIGGEVTGMASGKSLVLQNNGIHDLTLSSNGAFEFSAKVEAGKPYDVTVATQPQSQTCMVTNGSGTANAIVANIKVQCTDKPVVADTSAACFASDRPFIKGSSWTYVTPDKRASNEAAGEATFEGRKTYQIVKSNEGTPYRSTYTNNADGMSYVHGNSGNAGLPNALLRYTEVYTPALAVPLSLPLNQPHTASFTVVFTDPIRTITTQVVQTTAYLGRETIQTAFGTFETCKMQYTIQKDGGQPAVNTDWVIATGKLTGLIAQSNANGTTIQPTNIEVNWN